MSSKDKLSQQALNYHSAPVAGKIEIKPTKPCNTQEELSLAYTPGVAVPCLAIKDNKEDAYLYTAKGNLVAVVTNGTAVLGLGNIGAVAGKPVMEGKGILFKKFADVDVFDIELNSENAEDIIKTCQLLEPTFGGINLEDIKAPECFIIEEELKKTMNIPVFHDDQHGTAIVGAAALINALQIAGKKIEEVKVVMNGAGAAGIAIAELIIKLGVKRENLILCDTKGVIYKGRTEGMNPYKAKLATDEKCRTLEEAVKDADVLFGLSKKGAFSDEMIKSMAKNPIIFAMANPDPEITPEEVKKIRTDAIMATGRSDYPNQINNVMCFPFLFRGSLDVRTTVINDEMKMAAAHAIAALAHESVPESVRKAYNGRSFTFGKEYIIPTPFDPRLITRVSPAVAKAAMDTGVAQKPVKDFEEYKIQLEARINPAKRILLELLKKTNKKNKVGFTFAHKENVLSAAVKFTESGAGTAVLIGNEESIKKTANHMNIDCSKYTIIDPETYKDMDKLVDEYYEKFWRSGITRKKAEIEMGNGHYNRFAAALLNKGELDAVVGSAGSDIEYSIAAVSEVTDIHEEYYSPSVNVILADKTKTLVVSDPVIDKTGDVDALAELIVQSASVYSITGDKAKAAVISNGSFGASYESEEVAAAIDIAKDLNKHIDVEGEMDIETALNPVSALNYPLSSNKGDSNVLVFTNSAAADSVIKTMTMFGGFHIFAKAICGFEKSVQIAEHNADEEEIFHLAVIASVNA